MAITPRAPRRISIDLGNDQTFTLLARRVGGDDGAALISDVGNGDDHTLAYESSKRVLTTYACGWEDVLDEDGRPLPFDAAILPEFGLSETILMATLVLNGGQDVPGKSESRADSPSS